MESPLSEKLGYPFKDQSLLQQAMTHPSMASEQRGETSDNQRLEFLGDAVLKVILSEYFYCAFPDQAEGFLTKTRIRLEAGQSLANCARRLGLGEYLILGKGAEKQGGRDLDSNLEDAFEALVGAVYIDGGFSIATEVVLRVMKEDLEDVLASEDTGNPKGRLQEELQAIRRESPAYRVLDEEGPGHLKQFRVEVLWCGKPLGEGRGSSKKNAEASAAQDALEHRRWEE
jgi:ribonuclease-3